MAPAELHARSGNPRSPRPSGRCVGGHAPRAQLAGKSFAETIELNRTRIEAVAIQPLGLNRQMDMRARRVSMERQDIIVIVARSEEHTSELQSLMRISYAVFCLKKTNIKCTQIQCQHK